MISRVLIAAALVSGVSSINALGAAPAGTRIVALDHDGRLMVGSDPRELRPLLAVVAERSMPVWAPEGSRIAFIQDTDSSHALADLVVVDDHGAELLRVPIEPVTANLQYAGMRYVDEIRWLSADRIAVRGSLNPSQSQYYVFDAHSGKELMDLIDDDSAAAFSPDGLRVASVSGSPHFSRPEERNPTLSIDGQTILSRGKPPGLRFSELLSSPAWSSDGGALAVVGRRHGSDSPALFIWKAESALRVVPLPRDVPDDMRVMWANTEVLVFSSFGVARDAWSVDTVKLQVQRRRFEDTDYGKALRLRIALSQEVTTAGYTAPNLWCATCALRALPRSTDPN